MFYGEYYNKIDPKGRLRIPPKLKEGLGSKYLVTKGGGGCLFVFPSETMKSLEEKFAAIPFSDVSAQKPLRMLFSAGQMVEEDNQGRFLIPTNLREFAELSGEVAIIGAGTRIEIWDSLKWKEYNTCDDFDKVLESLSKFGV